MLRKNLVVTAAAVLSLSAAIGACTAAFSLIDALILRPLPVHGPEQLVFLSYPGFRLHFSDPAPGETDSFSYPVFKNLRDSAREQAALFGLTFGGPLQTATFDDAGGEEEKVRAQWISGDAFNALQIQPALGRLLTADDDQRSGEHSAAVLSHAFWTRRFGARPTVLGRWLTLNGRQLQIVGVADQRFSGLEPGYLTDVWAPLTTQPAARAAADPDSNWLQIWGRVQPGVAPEQARQVLQAAFTNFRRERTATLGRDGDFVNAPLKLNFAAHGRFSMLRLQFERPLWILGMVAALTLLIACSNVANLFIARGAAREPEMAMRISIGAGRARLVQQLLIESGLLAGVACLLGLAFAVWAAPPIVNLLAPADYPAYLDLHLDWRVLAFVAAVGVTTTLLFGMIPALRASAIAPGRALKADGGKGSTRIGILRPLLAAQVCFSFAVLFVAGLLLLSFQKLANVDLGFNKNGVILFTLDAKGLKGDPARRAELQLLEHVRQIPSVQSAGLSATGLIGGAFGWVITPTIRVPGRELVRHGAAYLEVSPGFFAAMQIRLLDGREFIPRDTEPEIGAAVIVNQAFARQYFPGESPLGRRFEQQGDDPRMIPQQIVGVVRDSKYNNLREGTRPTIYAPLRRVNGATLEVRTTADPQSIASVLRQEIPRVDPALRVTSVTLQSTRIDNTLLSERLLALLSGFFALVAIALAAVGLYGVLTYTVIRRTKEIGIRIALGARRWMVIRLVIADITITTVMGLIAGIAGGIAFARVLAAFLFEVKPSDFWSVALPLASLLLASVLAAIPPAMRTARVDPAVALRHE